MAFRPRPPHQFLPEDLVVAAVAVAIDAIKPHFWATYNFCFFFG